MKQLIRRSITPAQFMFVGLTLACPPSAAPDSPPAVKEAQPALIATVAEVEPWTWDRPNYSQEGFDTLIRVARILQRTDNRIVEQVLESPTINKCQSFLILRAMFELREDAPASMRMVNYWGGCEAAITGDHVNLSWPLSWKGGTPRLLARYEGYSGPRYSAVAEYRFLRSRFPLRRLSLPRTDARKPQMQVGEIPDGINVACSALRRLPPTAIFRAPFTMRISRKNGQWSIELRNDSVQEKIVIRRVVIDRKEGAQINIELVELAEVELEERDAREMSLRAQAVALFFERANLTLSDIQGAAVSVNMIGLEYSIVFDPMPHFFGSSSSAIVSRDFTKVTLFDRY